MPEADKTSPGSTTIAIRPGNGALRINTRFDLRCDKAESFCSGHATIIRPDACSVHLME